MQSSSGHVESLEQGSALEGFVHKQEQVLVCQSEAQLLARVSAEELER